VDVADAGSEIGVATDFDASAFFGAALLTSFAAGLPTAAALGSALGLDGPAAAFDSCNFGATGFVTGRFTGCAALGGVSGCFSAVFEALLVVGRIILARKLSSAGAVECGRLCLGCCFAAFEGGGPKDGLLCALLSVDGFLVSPEL
jgi:hypothetical protein